MSLSSQQKRADPVRLWDISSATTTLENVAMKVKGILTKGSICTKAGVCLLFQRQCKEAGAPAELRAGPDFPKCLIACWMLSTDVCVWCGPPYLPVLHGACCLWSPSAHCVACQITTSVQSLASGLLLLFTEGDFSAYFNYKSFFILV